MTTSQNASRAIWAMIILLLLAVTGLAATNIYLLLNDGDRGAPSAQDAEEEPPEELENPIYVKIEPFTVNIQSDEYGNRLLYTGLHLAVGNEETREFLDEHRPQVRSRLLSLFSAYDARTLTAPDGKEKVAGEVVSALQTSLDKRRPELSIEDVLFTEFIVQ